VELVIEDVRCKMGLRSWCVRSVRCIRGGCGGEMRMDGRWRGFYSGWVLDGVHIVSIKIRGKMN
jgi:hypothetical protein